MGGIVSTSSVMNGIDVSKFFDTPIPKVPEEVKTLFSGERPWKKIVIKENVGFAKSLAVVPNLLQKDVCYHSNYLLAITCPINYIDLE